MDIVVLFLQKTFKNYRQNILYRVRIVNRD